MTEAQLCYHGIPVIPTKIEARVSLLQQQVALWAINTQEKHDWRGPGYVSTNTQNNSERCGVLPVPYDSPPVIT